MTNQPEPTPGKAIPARQITEPLRELAALVLVAANALLLLVGFIDLVVPFGEGSSFGSRAGGAFFDFIGIEGIALPFLAVLLATHIQPPVRRAKEITLAAVAEYAVSAVFGGLALLAWLIDSLAEGRFRVAFTGLLLRGAYLAIFAVAAFAVVKVWRTLYYVPRPKAQPGVYGQPRPYGQPGYPPPGGGPHAYPTGYPQGSGYPAQAPGQPQPYGAPSGYGQPAGYGLPGQLGQPGAPSQPGVYGQPVSAAASVPSPAAPASAPPAPASAPPAPASAPPAPASAPPAAAAPVFSPAAAPSSAPPAAPSSAPPAQPAPGGPTGWSTPAADVVEPTQVIPPRSPAGSAGSPAAESADDSERTRPINLPSSPTASSATTGASTTTASSATTVASTTTGPAAADDADSERTRPINPVSQQPSAGARPPAPHSDDEPTEQHRR